MNEDMHLGMMMFCMVSGVLFSLVILVLVIAQTILHAKILKEVRRAPQKPGRAANP